MQYGNPLIHIACIYHLKCSRVLEMYFHKCIYISTSTLVGPICVQSEGSLKKPGLVCRSKRSNILLWKRIQFLYFNQLCKPNSISIHLKEILQLRKTTCHIRTAEVGPLFAIRYLRTQEVSNYRFVVSMTHWGMSEHCLIYLNGTNFLSAWCFEGNVTTVKWNDIFVQGLEWKLKSVWQTKEMLLWV